jgi:hypothetical protein
MKIKHKCGCITIDYHDGVAFVEMCKKHAMSNTYTWVGIKHKNLSDGKHKR